MVCFYAFRNGITNYYRFASQILSINRLPIKSYIVRCEHESRGHNANAIVIRLQPLALLCIEKFKVLPKCGSIYRLKASWSKFSHPTWFYRYPSFISLRVSRDRINRSYSKNNKKSINKDSSSNYSTFPPSLKISFSQFTSRTDAFYVRSFPLPFIKFLWTLQWTRLDFVRHVVVLVN